MADDTKVHDSVHRWVAEHVRSYVASDGRRGHRWSGVNTLVLTTKGRRSGKLYRTALIYGEDGDRYVVVASNGGAAKHPDWYRNLVADPSVEVQVGPDRFTVQASVVGNEDRERLWRQMAGIWPDYDSYQDRTERLIPVVILDPRLP